MKSHERQAIERLFARLAEAHRLPLRRDAEVGRLIEDLVARQPDASYLMAQTIIVQAQALRQVQESLDALTSSGPRSPNGKNGAARQPHKAADMAAPSDGFLESAAGVALAVSGAITVENSHS